jgi:hypothetical protein
MSWEYQDLEYPSKEQACIPDNKVHSSVLKIFLSPSELLYLIMVSTNISTVGANKINRSQDFVLSVLRVH